MGRRVVVIFLLALNYAAAQPGEMDPFGGYEMSFILVDDNTNSIVNRKNRAFDVFSSAFSEEGVEYFKKFKFNSVKNSFYYAFNSTPRGAEIPWQFAINVISGRDTMKIYFAESFINDTIHFRKGEYVACDQYLISNSIQTYNETKILKKDILDFEISKLKQIPYFSIRENGYTKLNLESSGGQNTIQLPNGEWIVHGIVHQKTYEGNVLDQHKGMGGSFSPYTNTTIINDFGIGYSPIKDTTNGVINYEYETLDTILMNIESDFSLKDKNFQGLFPYGLNWEDMNSITFAILTDLHSINDSLWTITLNKRNATRQIFISHDKGRTWQKSLSCESVTYKLKFHSHDNELYAYSGNSLYQSKNKGENWSRTTFNKNVENIRDVLNINDTLVFIITLVDESQSYDLVKFNPKTGESTRVLNCQISFAGGNGGLFYYDNMLVVSIHRGFLKSDDFGLTWTVVSNDCIRILKKSTIWIWHKQEEAKESLQRQHLSNYFIYGHQAYECDGWYSLLSSIQSNDDKLKVIYKYNQHGDYPHYMFSELTFIGFE